MNVHFASMLSPLRVLLIMCESIISMEVAVSRGQSMERPSPGIQGIEHPPWPRRPSQCCCIKSAPRTIGSTAAGSVGSIVDGREVVKLIESKSENKEEDKDELEDCGYSKQQPTPSSDNEESDAPPFEYMKWND